MDIDQQLESLYDEIGEHCPYKLAKHFGVKLINRDLGIDQLCGMYKSTPIGARIYLNANTDIETQETTCYLLVKQHIANGEDLSIFRSDLLKYNRVEKAVRKYLRVMSESFLSSFAKIQRT